MAGEQRCGDVGTKATLLILANYADENFSCFPSQETIAEESEQSVSSVYRQLKRLEALSLIRREKRYDGRGKRTSDRFFLNLDLVVNVHDPDFRCSDQQEQLPVSETGSDPAVSALPVSETSSRPGSLPVSETGRGDPDYRSPETTTTGHPRQPLPVTGDRGTPSRTPSRTPRSRSEPASQSQNGGLEGKSPSRPRERASSNGKRAKAERTKVDRTPEQQAIFDEASKITTAWWEYLKGQGVTVMDSRQFLGCRESIVENALTRGATPDQVKSALVACGIPFPPAAQFERALVAIQTGRSTAPSGGQPRGRPANVWIDPNATQADRDRSASLWAGVSINGKRVDLQ